MQGSGIQSIEIVLLLPLLFVAGFTALARKLQTPYPIVLVLAGLVLSHVPGIPRVTLDPDLIFLVVLPPLFFRLRGLLHGVILFITSSAFRHWPLGWWDSLCWEWLEPLTSPFPALTGGWEWF